jgi:hypothetical protein
MLLDEPLFSRLVGIEQPAPQSLLQWPKHVIVTVGDIGAVRGVIQNTSAKTVQGVPCCVGSMWACVIVEHNHTSSQFSSYPGSTIGIVAACVYVSLEQPLYVRACSHIDLGMWPYSMVFPEHSVIL